MQKLTKMQEQDIGVLSANISISTLPRKHPPFKKSGAKLRRTRKLLGSEAPSQQMVINPAIYDEECRLSFVDGVDNTNNVQR